MLIRAPAISDVPPLPSGCALAFSTSVTWLAPTGTPAGKRLYLYPGLDSGVSQWTSGTPLELVNDFQAAGYEVVLLPIPNTLACFFTDGGWQYRTQFVAAMNAVMNAIEAAHGPSPDNIIGGISFGGLHAMIGMASSGRFKSWFAHLPVTYINALTEFPGVGPAARFNPFFELPSLVNTTGLITWGTADERTNWTLTAALAAKLGPGVTKIVYPGEDHTTTDQNVSDIASWVAAH